ncbi:MAG: hypothetical protein A2268_03535 [Candidatus Raymondbacteria bacterium RifOxyA12_full_50_37]|uniref:Secretion system C-terminal sorting domain-containing protein n=1 Tax=Candidatus Raymondbacteria bacterium RIFOXYD12_FULL_49_13 TaxID=1817890 RepID=A0A1F7FI42_UNCRA|nr:MAG: hypothetical protein A2268_03535 [Candidatus Raymondbacteria bacterium RifOxyA12_full_50_37]OGJ89651.1 MAG: hypothetical protein A2248_08240 [Candidatus Raymondbacteria bacterium RIFOXYA2_FULL_49_16]OGK06126.1 MAG: hypothetical protein A2519_16790 [Candidatus Raymondbacteria bacterium RIFOXYD12_FULL_49_13]OGP42845.1 MAG: hypothetical protein A2324_04095 [Candidatus Raymondbacteria bacterium RIFOXYB2_FULL_49_35]
MKKIFFAYFFICAAIAYGAITTQTWTMYVSGAAFWGGIGRDWNGTVYAGLGNHLTNDNANSVVYRYNNSTNDWTQVMDVKVVSQAAGNWLALDRPGKIHSTIKQGLDGKLYFSTHSAFDTDNDLANYPSLFRGGHFYCYDPISGQGRDLSDPNVGAGHCGLTDLAVATQYNLVYGIGYPYGYMYKQDIRNGDSTFLWATQSQVGQVSRVVLEDNYGRFLCPNVTKRFLIYDPVTDSVTFDRFRHNYGTTITAAVKSWTGDSIYYIMSEGGDDRIFRYIVSRDTAQFVAYVDSGNTSSFKASLALRWDQNKLYIALGNRLVSINALTGARITEATNLPNPSYGWYGCNGIDRNGDLFFSAAGNRTVMKVSLAQPCAICTQKPKYLDSAYVDSVDNAWRTSTVAESAEKSLSGILTATPNPFNPDVTIVVAGAFRETFPHIMIFDITGRFVADLTSQVYQGRVSWNASGMPSGIYIIKAWAGKQALTKAITLIK